MTSECRLVKWQNLHCNFNWRSMPYPRLLSDVELNLICYRPDALQPWRITHVGFDLSLIYLQNAAIGKARRSYHVYCTGYISSKPLSSGYARIASTSCYQTVNPTIMSTEFIYHVIAKDKSRPQHTYCCEKCEAQLHVRDCSDQGGYWTNQKSMSKDRSAKVVPYIIKSPVQRGIDTIYHSSRITYDHETLKPILPELVWENSYSCG